jgi:uncharacterized protein (UPF0335 family)
MPLGNVRVQGKNREAQKKQNEFLLNLVERIDNLEQENIKIKAEIKKLSKPLIRGVKNGESE